MLFFDWKVRSPDLNPIENVYLAATDLKTAKQNFQKK